MKIILLLLLAFWVNLSLLYAQETDTDKEKKLKQIADNIPFPEVYVNFKIGFNAEMLDISKLPVKNRYKEMSLSDLETAYSNGNVEFALILELYYNYIAKGDNEKAYFSLMQAYEKAMAKHKADPSDFNAQIYLSDILFLIDRKQDIVPMWESFVANNPKSAKAWAKLGLFQYLNNNDSTAALKNFEKALSIDSEEPEIYSAALSLMLSKIALRAKTQYADNYPISLSFFENALKKYPKSKLASFNLEVASTVKLFYDYFFDIAARADNGEKELSLNAEGEKELARLKKVMRAYSTSNKIVNKFTAYKCMLMLDVLKGQKESAENNSKSALAIIGTDTELLRLMSIIYSIKSDYEKAAVYLSKALDEHAIPPDLFALARMYYEADNFQESFLLLKKLYNGYPNYYDFIFGIISIKMSELNFDEACKLLDEMKHYFTAETKIEEHPYYIFFSALCVLVKDSKNTAALAKLQRIADSELSWAVHAKTLLASFK